jgi:hypothetical protein
LRQCNGKGRGHDDGGEAEVERKQNILLGKRKTAFPSPSHRPLNVAYWSYQIRVSPRDLIIALTAVQYGSQNACCAI